LLLGRLVHITSSAGGDAAAAVVAAAACCTATYNNQLVVDIINIGREAKRNLNRIVGEGRARIERQNIICAACVTTC
jgi:hypothetical protein